MYPYEKALETYAERKNLKKLHCTVSLFTLKTNGAYFAVMLAQDTVENLQKNMCAMEVAKEVKSRSPESSIRKQ